MSDAEGYSSGSGIVNTSRSRHFLVVNSAIQFSRLRQSGSTDCVFCHTDTTTPEHNNLSLTKQYSFYEEELTTTTIPRAVVENRPSGEEAVRAGIEFIEAYDREEPFCLYVGFGGHTTRSIPPRRSPTATTLRRCRRRSSRRHSGSGCPRGPTSSCASKG